MKNKINLLLIFGLPLLVMNCSGKNSYTLPPEIHASIPTPIPVQRTPKNRPSLGTPILVPSTVSRPIPIQRERTAQSTPRSIPHRPRVEQHSKAGQSSIVKKFVLPHRIEETSGLIKLDNKLWTLNDSGGRPALYQIDERSGRIVKTFTIPNASNKDWEDIAYDDTYVYIGDMGNNRGNRKDLKIYKIPRASLRNQKSARAEVIYFKYSDQKDFRSKPQKNNYDCEAMVAYHGKLYLFSKNWQNQKTRLYELSTIAGRRQAKYISSFNIQGMVTGATINTELDILLLTTYSSLLSVNVWAFTNYRGNNFFNGNTKRLNLRPSLQGQVEGVTFVGNHKAYLSSEAFTKYIFSLDASLYTLDFSGEFE